MKVDQYVTVFVQNGAYTVYGVTDGDNSIHAEVSGLNQLGIGAHNYPTNVLRDAVQERFGLNCVRIERDTIGYCANNGWSGFCIIKGKIVAE